MKKLIEYYEMNDGLLTFIFLFLVGIITFLITWVSIGIGTHFRADPNDFWCIMPALVAAGLFVLLTIVFPYLIQDRKDLLTIVLIVYHFVMFFVDYIVAISKYLFISLIYFWYTRSERPGVSFWGYWLNKGE